MFGSLAHVIPQESESSSESKQIHFKNLFGYTSLKPEDVRNFRFLLEKQVRR
jgi:hypothetical protein